MGGFVVPDNHRCLKGAQDVQLFGQDFFNQHQIQYFQYARYYRDGKILVLGNNAPLLQAYACSDVYITLELCLEQFGSKSVHYAFAEQHPEMAKFLAAFGVANYMVVVNKFNDYLDFFAYATPDAIAAPDAVSGYLNQLPVLCKYTDYFLENMGDELADLAEDCFPVSACVKDGMAAVFDKHPPLVNAHGKYQVGQYQLTKRQLQCLKHSLQGGTAKDIGLCLDISYRTVEIHLAKLRAIFECRNKYELHHKAEQLVFDWDGV